MDSARFDARPLRTLFVRYERIGDMIMATGLIRVLANASSAGKVDVVASPGGAPVLIGNPHVGKVFVLDRGSWASYRKMMRALRFEHYDVIVDGRINNPRAFTSTPMLMLGARAPYRIGVGGGNNDLVYNVAVQGYDRSTPYIEGSKALSQPFKVDPETVDWRPEIFLSDEERSVAEEHWEKAAGLVAGANYGRLLVNISASEEKRRWPDARFIEVLQQIRKQRPKLGIVVIGLPAEWERVSEVARGANAWPVPTPRLRDALALVGTSDMVFTPDTSISHAASAFSKPAVVLLKRDHHPYAPYNIPGENLFWDGNQIHDFPVERVLPAVQRLVDTY